MLVTINKNIIKKIAAISIIAVAVFLLSFSLISGSVLAQDSADTIAFGGLQNQIGNTIGLSSENPLIIIAKIIRIFIGFLGIIALGLIIYAGFVWMTSEGDESKITKAKQILKNAVIGLIIILISFAIVTFILNRFLGMYGGSGAPTTPPPPGGGLGAIGSCTVESVYPTPGQTDMPRNTTVIVTFKEAVDINTICNDDGSGGGTLGDGQCTGGEYIIPQNVIIYKTVDGDACGVDPNCIGNVLDVNVVPTTNKKTFVFIFNTWLGSPSEFIWYTVELTNSINKLAPTNPAKPGIFETCNPRYLKWQFEVNNLIDLTPPKVKNYGVFPPPDDTKDSYSTTVAVQATGSITVAGPPSVYVAANFTPPLSPSATAPSATLTMDSNCQDSGDFIIVMQSPTIAELSKVSTGNLLGTANLNGSSFTFPNYFTLDITGNVSNLALGQSWNINSVIAMIPADNLTVGGKTYVFGTDIAVNASNNITASNIANVLNGNQGLTASAAGSIVNLIAITAGSAGNNISISTSNTTALNPIVAMYGGLDAQTTSTVNDMPDQPKNAVIQVNFNEAVNPVTLSGDANQVSNYIRVVNDDPTAKAAGAGCSLDSECLSFDCAGTCVNDYLDGKWEMSNIYRTVEFITTDLCGVNGCGESIYCLPGDAELKVELMAAALDGCGANSDCATLTPYTTCQPTPGSSASKVCYDNNNSIFYPLSAIPFTGIMDTALNSLDGNRDNDADGPQAQSGKPFLDENNSDPINQGDDYKWSFWTSDIINLTPPTITNISPAHDTGNILLTAPVSATFDKLLMSSSLRTGVNNIFNGNVYISHWLVNIWNFGSKPLGFWISKDDFDISPIPDGWPDITRGNINHSMFYDSTSYRTQFGSGVKDIYQNCFKPSSGLGCLAGATNSSCCPAGPGTISPLMVPAGSKCP